MVSLAAGSPASARPASTRRGGWMLIASSLVFIVSLTVLFTLGSGYQREISDAAERAGTSISGVPEVERAEIAGRHQLFYVISVTLFVVPYVALVFGIREVNASLPTIDRSLGWLKRLAWLGSATCLIIWIIVTVISLGFIGDPENLGPVVRDFNTFAPPMIVMAASLGAIAVCCAALAARHVQIAPRVALVVVAIIVSILLFTLVTSLATGSMPAVPQFLPLVGATILGMGLVRPTASKQT